jgi:hypothetical protein
VNARLRALRASGLEPSERPELDQTLVAEERDEVRRMYRSSWDVDEAESLAAAAHPPAFR